MPVDSSLGHSHDIHIIDDPGPARRRRRSKVLVPVHTARHAESLISTAAALARSSDSEVLVLYVTRVPPQLPLSEAHRFHEAARPTTQAMHRMREHIVDVPIGLALTAGRRIDEVIINATRRDDIPCLVLDFDAARAPRPNARVDVRRVLRAASCDVLVLRSAREPVVPTRVVLAVRPLEDDVDAVVPAVALARHHHVPLHIVSILNEDTDRATEIDARMWLVRLRGRILDAGIRDRDLHQRILRSDSLGCALVDHSHRDDLVVLGAPQPPIWPWRSILQDLPVRPVDLPGATVVYRAMSRIGPVARLRRLLRI